jgi:trk system potassium uptake protein
VKLLRVYALFRHGERELERLVHPNSIGHGGALARRLRRKGAYVAWIFFMIFAITIAVVMLALTAVGVAFEPAMVLAVAALSTTGPLAAVATEDPILYVILSDPAKVILAVTMVVGRLETLAILALLAPDGWRR